MIHHLMSSHDTPKETQGLDAQSEYSGHCAELKVAPWHESRTHETRAHRTGRDEGATERLK